MKKSRVAIAIAAFGMATVLVGCSNPAPDTADQPTSATLSMATNGLPDGLTPSKWNGGASHFVYSGLGSQLITYDLGSTVEEACDTPSFDKWKPRLAESIEFNDDRSAIVIKLNDLTSQWGNKLSAEDVKWSFEMGMIRDTGVFKGALGKAGFDLDNIATVIDEKTVEMNVLAANSYTISGLSQIQFIIFDSTEAKKHATADDPQADVWLSENLADYSGWKLTNFTPGSSLVLEADPNWGGERGNITKIVANAVPDTATRAELVNRGEVQYADGFAFEQYAEFKQDEDLKVQRCLALGRDTMMLNTKNEFLKDPRVRQAVSMAIDREALVKGPYAGLAEAATAAFVGLKDHPSYKHDVEAAKKLLAEAGLPDGFKISISYGTARPGPVVAQSAVLLKSQLAEVGIDAELVVVASGTDLSTILYDGGYDILLYAEPIVNPDPAFYAFPFHSCDGNSNGTGWCEPEYDKLLAELTATPAEDTSERQAIFEEMGVIAAEGAANLALVVPNNANVTSAGLSGGIMSTNGRVYFNDLTLGN